MVRNKGQPTPDYCPPAHNPHYGGQHPPAYSQQPPSHQLQPTPPPHQQQYRSQPQQHRPLPQQPNRGGGGNVNHKPPRRPHRPSEVSDCVKYSLFLYNIFFWVVGLLFIGAGVWALNDRGFFNQVKAFDSSDGVTAILTDPVLWLFFLGSVVFVLGTLGCLGALRENICMLKMFGVFMGLILLCEVGGGVAVYLYRNEIESEVTNTISEVTVREYRDNEDFQDLIDAAQSSLQCCGANSYNDWDMNIYFNCSGPANNPEACGVPFSCCIPDTDSEVVNTQCGYGVRKSGVVVSSRIHTTGCIEAVQDWISQYYIPLGIVAGSIIMVELFGFCFGYSLINDIKRQKSRWASR